MSKVDTSTWTKHELEQGFAIRRNKGGGYFALMLDGSKANAKKVIAGKQANKLTRLKVEERHEMYEKARAFDNSIEHANAEDKAKMQKLRTEIDRKAGKITENQYKDMNNYIDDTKGKGISYEDLYGTSKALTEEIQRKSNKKEIDAKVRKKIAQDNAKKKSYDEVLSGKLKNMDKYDLERMQDSDNETLSNIAKVEQERRYKENEKEYARLGKDYYKGFKDEYIEEDIKTIGVGLAAGLYSGKQKEEMRKQFESGKAYLQKRFRQKQQENKDNYEYKVYDERARELVGKYKTIEEAYEAQKKVRKEHNDMGLEGKVYLYYTSNGYNDGQTYKIVKRNGKYYITDYRMGKMF